MNIIPAIDLQNGKCVRLYRGNFEDSIIYSADPVSTALNFQRQGAQQLHVVDLDGARTGIVTQYEIIKKIIEATKLKVQVGGGVRMGYQLARLFEIGVDRVVIGSQAIEEPEMVKTWIQKYGAEKIVLAMDIKIVKNIPIVVTEGWLKQSGISLWELIQTFPDLKNVLCTDVSRDGTLTGPNSDLYTLCMDKLRTINWIASGGISSLSDLKRLQSIGMSDAIIGKALYENIFTVEEALAC